MGFLASSTINAANITINDTSSGGIHGALSSANSSDTIILQPGSYSGSNNTNLQVNKNITIRGNGSSNQVIINGSGVSQLFSTAGNALNITFINITFANAFNGVMTDYQSGTINFINCTFIDNSGSALVMGYNSNYNVVNSTFYNNTGQSGGAINNNGGNLNIANSSFINNSASVIGGAINNNNGHSNITNTTFIGNNASSDGGAIHISGNVNNNIVSSYFYNNTAISGVGGAIFSNAGNTNVTQSDFVNNTDGYGDGGAIGFDGGNVILNYNRFYNNNATPTGYQVYAGGGTFDFSMNWWGDNNRAYYFDNTGRVNVSTNWVVVDVNYTGNGSDDPNSEFYYYIQLSDGSAFNPSLLPFFSLDEGAGPNPTLIPQWDARTNQTLYVAVIPYSIMVTFGVDDWRKVFWANGTNHINLTITKVANVTGDLSYGQLINYTITVTNHGPNNATGVVVNETLPGDLIFVSAVGDGSYDNVTGLWYIGNLNNGSTATLVITVQINGSGVIVNTANVTANEPNINNETNATAIITVRPYINLTISKVANVTGDLSYGQLINYTIAVINYGPDNATGVIVNEILPSGLIFVSAVGDGSYDNDTGVWYIGNLADGSSATLVITVQINGTGVIVNNVNVTANQSNINNETNITTNITVVPKVNLTLNKIVYDVNYNVVNSVVNGQTIIYWITVTNYGPNDATNVKVNELLPSGLIYITDSSNGAYNNVTGVWNIGNLANGGTAILAITVRVNATTNGGSVTLVNGVNVTANENNTNNDTNSSNITANVTVVPGVNLTLSKVANVTGDVINGQLINYTIAVINYGPDNATGVIVNEILPSGLIYIGDNGSGSYDPVTGVWNIGVLNNGQTVVLVITVRVNGTGVIVNGINVTANENNTNNDTNSSNITTNITAVPGINLTLTKVANVTGDVWDEDVINYTITVTNYGPNDATGVIVNELLPSSLVYIGDSSGGFYDPVTGVWDVGSLANGSSAVLVLTVRVNGTGLIVNGINVTANENNTNNDTNSSNITANITARPYVNITLTKVANVTGVIVNGQTINYTITVTNYGPDDATNVIINEILPTSLIYINSSGTQGTYNPISGVWDVGSLVNGSSAVLVITVRVNGTGLIVNGVNVTVNQTNINNDTNSSNITVNITVKITSNSTVVAPNGKVGHQSIISGVALDENSNPLANINLTVVVNGTSYNVNTDGSGAWSLNYTPTTSGNLNVAVSWTGNSTHVGFTNSTIFNVGKLNTSVTINAPNSKVGEETTISGILTDENGNPIANANLEVIVDGKSFSVKTNAFGVWVLKYTPKRSGILFVSVNYNGNNIYYGSTNSTNFKVKENTTPINPNGTNKTSHNPAVSKAAMKETGIPIIVIILLLLSSLGLTYSRKREK